MDSLKSEGDSADNGGTSAASHPPLTGLGDLCELHDLIQFFQHL